jgi:type I restriction enzyme S subunit
MSQLKSEKDDANHQQELHALPDGWSWTPLGEICDAINGRAFKSTEWRDSGVPIIRIQNLKDPDASFNYFQGELDEKNKVKAGDLLFAWSGTPGTSFGAHIWRGQNAALNQHIFNVQFDRAQIDTKYFCYALNQNISRYVAQAQGGVGLAHITKSKFMASKVPIASLDQQRRIVAEIEKQFSRLDEAVANLKRVKANLKRYKAAVLKAAVEGKLTEEWRRQHPDVEPASKLLERILAERRAKWKGRGKYKEPVEPDTSNLPSLAEGWRWVSLEQLSWHSSYGTSVKCSYENSGPTVLRIPNIESGKLDFGDLKFAPKSLEIERGEELSVGDVLIIRTNGSRSLIGRSAVVRQPIPSRSTYASYLIRFRLVEQSEVIAWVSTVWDADFFRQWIEQKAATSAGQHNISMTVLGTLPIPLPPLAEQERIVAEVERRLSVIEEIEASVEANLTRADCLRQSILSNAFSGKLKVEKPTKQYV